MRTRADGTDLRATTRGRSTLASRPSRTRLAAGSLALALTLAGSPPGVAQTAEDATSPGSDTPESASRVSAPSLEALVDAYIGAVKASDMATYRALQQPYLDQCITPENEAAYAHMFELELRSYVVDPPDVRIGPVDAKTLAERAQWLSQLSGEKLGLDETPSHYFELTQAAFFPPAHPCYAPASHRVKRFAKADGGEWRIVPQCLSGSMLAAVEEHMQTQRAVRKMQTDLYDALDTAGRDRLADLIRTEGPKRAAERYAAQSGTGAGASLRLIERICEDL